MSCNFIVCRLVVWFVCRLFLCPSRTVFIQCEFRFRFICPALYDTIMANESGRRVMSISFSLFIYFRFPSACNLNIIFDRQYISASYSLLLLYWFRSCFLLATEAGVGIYYSLFHETHIYDGVVI